MAETVEHSVGRRVPARRLSRLSLSLGGLLACLPLCALAQDGDADGVPDLGDNCVEVSNPDQKNSDFDAFGNVCDGDLNNDGATDAIDAGLLDDEIAAPEPVQAADLDGNGLVDALDRAYFDTELVGFLNRTVLEHPTVRAEREYDFRQGLVGGSRPPDLDDVEPLPRIEDRDDASEDEDDRDERDGQHLRTLEL